MEGAGGTQACARCGAALPEPGAACARCIYEPMPAALAAPVAEEPVGAGFELAGIGVRWLALMLDSFYVIALGIPILIAATLWLGPEYYLVEGSNSAADAGLTALFIAVAVVYEGWMLGRRGQTVGKVLLSIQVRQSPDLPLKPGQGWGRAVARWLLSVFGLAAVIDYLTGVFSDERRTLHDRMGGTRVYTWTRQEDRPKDRLKVALWAVLGFVFVTLACGAAGFVAAVVRG